MNSGKSDVILDIVFALGASEPNGKTTFELEKNLTNLLIDLQSGVVPRYGVVTYSNTAQTTVRVQKFNYVYRLKDQIRDIKWPGSGTGIDSALQQAYSLFTKSAPGSNKVLVLFMSGKASSSLSTLRQAVRLLMNLRVRVVVIGYGSRLDVQQLRILSENPDNIINPSGVVDQDDTYKISMAIFKG